MDALREMATGDSDTAGRACTQDFMSFIAAPPEDFTIKRNFTAGQNVFSDS